jgi:hypothetical protein
MLFAGFIGTGLVAFLVWRQRMREGPGFSAHHAPTVPRSTR